MGVSSVILQSPDLRFAQIRRPKYSGTGVPPVRDMNSPTHPAALPDDALLAECDLGRGRASGPGGQHRNKVETAVTLTHRPTGVTAQASERRSQIENKRVALRRLRLKLATEVRVSLSPCERGPGGEGQNTARPRTSQQLTPETRLGEPGHPGADFLDTLDAGSELWRSRRQGARLVVNPDHRDYPALLAEALDAIAAAGWAPAPAAARLAVTPTQLVKLIKDHPPAFERLNWERTELGMHRLK